MLPKICDENAENSLSTKSSVLLMLVVVLLLDYLSSPQRESLCPASWSRKEKRPRLKMNIASRDFHDKTKKIISLLASLLDS